MKSHKPAFTLVELLVVVAIIGLLASISVIALSSARTKARDARRVGDVKQVTTALELFFNDYGRYPTDQEWALGYLVSPDGSSTYLSTIPSAPNPPDGSCDSSTNQFSYTQDNNGESYTITFCTGANIAALSAGNLCANPGGISACAGGGCTLDCSGHNCGDDGCGGSCGSCTGNDVCTSGTCTTPPFACGDQITITSLLGHTCNTDAPDYDTCTYDTVQIGTQCWMQENMNVGAYITGVTEQVNNSSLEKYCGYDWAGGCPSYGALYQWDETMQYSTSEEAQGICPSGWHIPSDAEQNTLDQFLNDTTCDVNRVGIFDCANAGTKLKTGGTSHFEGILSGIRIADSGAFWDSLVYGYYWSSTVNGLDAWVRVLGGNYTTVYRGYFAKDFGFSVRCLQN